MSLNTYYNFLEKSGNKDREEQNILGEKLVNNLNNSKKVAIKKPKEIKGFNLEIKVKDKDIKSFKFSEYKPPEKWYKKASVNLPIRDGNQNIIVEYEEPKPVKIPFKKKQKVEKTNYNYNFAKNVLVDSQKEELDPNFKLVPMNIQLDVRNPNILDDNYHLPKDELQFRATDDILEQDYSKKILRLHPLGRADFIEHPLDENSKLDLVEEELFGNDGWGLGRILTEDELRQARQDYIDRTELAKNISEENSARKIKSFLLRSTAKNKLNRLKEDYRRREEAAEERRRNTSNLANEKLENLKKERADKIKMNREIRDKLKEDAKIEAQKIDKRKRMNDYIEFLKNRELENEILGKEDAEKKITKVQAEVRRRRAQKRFPEKRQAYREALENSRNKIIKIQSAKRIKNTIVKSPLVAKIREKIAQRPPEEEFQRPPPEEEYQRPPEDILPQTLTQSTQEDEEEEHKRPQEEEEEVEAKTPEEREFLRDKMKELNFYYKGKGRNPDTKIFLRRILLEVGYTGDTDVTLSKLREIYSHVLYKARETDPVVPGIPEVDVKTSYFVKALSHHLMTNYNNEGGKEELYNTLRAGGYVLGQSVDRMSRIDVMQHYIRHLLRRYGFVAPVGGSE